MPSRLQRERKKEGRDRENVSVREIESDGCSKRSTKRGKEKKKTGMNTARLRAVRKRVINNIKAQREMR